MAQPADSQPTNPLDSLRGIQLPEEAGFWELAPGWWILIGLLFAYLIYLTIQWNKKRQRLALLKPAKLELATIANQTPDNHAVADLSALLKRVCLLYYPNKQVAALSGNQWIAFLNQQAAEPIFDKNAVTIFSETLYRKEQLVADRDWQNLLVQSETMIDFIIRNKARQTL